MTVTFDLPVPARHPVDPDFLAPPITGSVETHDDRRHRELLEALGFLAEQHAPPDPLIVPAPVPMGDVAGAITTGLAPLLGENARTAEALEQVTQRLVTLGKQISASAVGSSGGGGGRVQITNDSSEPLPVDLGDVPDPHNTATITAAIAQPGNPWEGEPSRVQSEGFIGTFLSLIGAAVGGTYHFKYGPDGSSWPIDITLHTADLSTIRYQPLKVAGEFFQATFEPDLPLGADIIYVTTTHSKQAAPDFVVPASHVFEEANASFAPQWAFLKAFDDRGDSTNVRATPLGDLRVADERLGVTESGSLDTESVRDDVSISFSRDSGATSIAALMNMSVGGTVTHDTTEGRALFTTSSVAGSTSYYESAKTAVYEAGHMIRGEQTIEITPALAGTAKVEWGFGEDNGTGDVLNGIGWGMDATGLYVWRKKAGVYASKVYQTSFNRDVLDGIDPTRYRIGSGPVAFDGTKNGLFLTGFEWLGVAPPFYRIQAPVGEFVTVHVEETSGRINGTTVPEPELPMFVRVSNGDQAVNYQVASGSWRGGIYTSKSLTQGALSGDTGQQDVTTVSTPLAFNFNGRTSVRLKNMTTSARPLIFGFSGSLTALNGDELAVGESIDLDLDEDVPVYVITTSTSGGGVRTSWTVLGS